MELEGSSIRSRATGVLWCPAHASQGAVADSTSLPWPSARPCSAGAHASEGPPCGRRPRVAADAHVFPPPSGLPGAAPGGPRRCPPGQGSGVGCLTASRTRSRGCGTACRTPIILDRSLPVVTGARLVAACPADRELGDVRPWSCLHARAGEAERATRYTACLAQPANLEILRGVVDLRPTPHAGRPAWGLWTYQARC